MPKFTLASFITCYIGVAIYLINIIGWKLIKGTKRVKAHEMDLVTGRREFEEMEEMERARTGDKMGFKKRLSGFRKSKATV